MIQDEADDAAEDEAEESITITHGDAGTEVKIEDPTFSEIVTLIVLGLIVALLLWGAWKSKHGRRRYRL